MNVVATILKEWARQEASHIFESSNLDEEVHKAATSPENDLPEPTDAQKKAGKYKMGHIKIAGMDIAIENPKGSIRSGIDPNGKRWTIELKDHYGYVKKSIGKDKDHVDVFINPDLDKEEIEKLPVFVIDQINLDGSFDEHKCIMGQSTQKEAKKAYLRNYKKGWLGLGAITTMAMDEFKDWVMNPKATKKALILESITPELKTSVTKAKKIEEIKLLFFNTFGFTEMEYEGSKKKTEYVDVGEKIGGAKKDIWMPGERRLRLSDMEDMDSAQAFKVVNKKNVLEGVFEDIQESGVDPGAGWMIDKVFKAIVPKPDDTDEARKGYVAAIENLQEYFTTVKTLDDLKESLSQIKDEIRGYSLNPEEAELSQKYNQAQTQFQKARQAEYSKIVERLKGNGKKINYYDASEELDTWSQKNRKSFFPDDLDKRYYEERRKWEEREETNPQSKRNQYKTLGKRFLDAVTLKSQAFVDNFNDAYRGKITDFSWMESSQPKKKVKKEKPKWSRIVPDEVEREGGQKMDFKPKDLLETFKIRGVEYGNWMDEESSQHHTQMLGESFLDLSDVLGIPLEQISYGGRLGIAFGARGSGAASAHYEPDKKAINMTKLRGGGSLAHEWGHFLDNVVSMLSTNNEKKFGFCSSGNIGENIDPEIGQVFKELDDAINKGNVRPHKSEKLPEGKRLFWPFYSKAPEADHPDPQAVMDKYSDAKKRRWDNKTGQYIEKPVYNQKVLKATADYIHTVTGKEVTYGEGTSAFYAASRDMTKQKKSYWTKPDELFARAFEAYINKKMRTKGAKNTYLVSGIPVNDKTMPYPVGEELEKLEKIFDKLIETLKKHDIFESVMRFLDEIDEDVEALDNL